MILIDTDLYYDETLSFEEQSDDVKNFIYEEMKNTPVKETDATCGRTESETWNKTTYEIVRTYSYIAPVTANNCYALGSTTININEL